MMHQALLINQQEHQSNALSTASISRFETGNDSLWLSENSNTTCAIRESDPDSFGSSTDCPGMSDLKFHGLLELACSALGFEVGEIWQVKNYNDASKRTLQFRHIHITHISDEQRSHLECPDSEGRSFDESKHKVSPVLCRNACDSGQIVLVNAKACEGLVVRTQSTLPLHTAVAAPCFPPGSRDHMFVIILFSAQNRQISFQMIEFLCSLTALIKGGPASDHPHIKEGSLMLKASTSDADLQKYYVDSSKSSSDRKVENNVGSVENLPITFFGEPDSLVDIRRNSNMNDLDLDGVLAHQERGERYKHFMAGVLQLTSFDIAELWLPDALPEDISSSQGGTAAPVKMSSSCHLEPAMQPWIDFSKLLTLPPDLDFPGRIVAAGTPLVDDKYNTHQPFDVKYPRAMNAHFLGLQVAFGIPVPGNCQSRGALVFYARDNVALRGKLLRMVSCGATLLASGLGGSTTQGSAGREAGTDASTDNSGPSGSAGGGVEESKGSKDLIDIAFMSALDTVFEDESDWDMFCQDTHDGGTPTHSSSSQQQPLWQSSTPQQQPGGLSMSSVSASSSDADPQFKQLTSRIFSETVVSSHFQARGADDMSKKSRTCYGEDTSHGIVQEHVAQSYQQHQDLQHPQQPPQQQSQQQPQQFYYHPNTESQHQMQPSRQLHHRIQQQPQQQTHVQSLAHSHRVAASLSDSGHAVSTCMNCQKLSETVNGYCMGCNQALAAYFSRNNDSYGGSIGDGALKREQERLHGQQQQQHWGPPSARMIDGRGWDHHQSNGQVLPPQSRHSSLPPQYELRKSHTETTMDELDMSRHSHQSDLDHSQHSTRSYHGTDPTPGVDLHSFRSTLDINRQYQNTHSDPLDVQHHPVNVNRYHFFNTKQPSHHPNGGGGGNWDNLDVSRHSNVSDTDYELDETHHPVNVERYRHTGGNFADYSNHSTQSVETTRSDVAANTCKRKICRFEGCVEVAIFRSPYCSSHAGNRKCLFEGCTKCAQGSTKYCISHGGGRRCTFQGCNKGARDKYFCAAHGGGKRCTMIGCVKSAVGRSTFCTSHGGGKRCAEPGCTKSSQSSTQFCVRHGGGRKCALVGCNKVARGRTNFCATHKRQDDAGQDDKHDRRAVKDISAAPTGTAASVPKTSSEGHGELKMDSSTPSPSHISPASVSDLVTLRTDTLKEQPGNIVIANVPEHMQQSQEPAVIVDGSTMI